MIGERIMVLLYGDRMKDSAFVRECEETYRKLQRMGMDPFRCYALYCTYHVRGHRDKARVLKRGLPWDEARDLQHRLQERAIRQAGPRWSSWTGRLYHLHLEPVIGEVPVQPRFTSLCDEQEGRYGASDCNQAGRCH